MLRHFVHEAESRQFDDEEHGTIGYVMTGFLQKTINNAKVL